ncbi:hypothetical protein NDU88_003467 [Pleurodeles waltl]|uniref:Uncharacterized protein n=1 Tax=Pleurodeles waltl TaxID=8319 RepID=A0AAV7V039_PLEWA|nr:hypothetical protein NDU88_003467 [Pleurodeles waltl]
MSTCTLKAELEREQQNCFPNAALKLFTPLVLLPSADMYHEGKDDLSSSSSAHKRSVALEPALMSRAWENHWSRDSQDLRPQRTTGLAPRTEVWNNRPHVPEPLECEAAKDPKQNNCMSA